jgi:cell wall-associated NlpC family hydrolase
MKKRILSLIMATGLIMSISMPTLAESLTKQLNNQKQQLLEQQNSYAKVQKNFEKLEISIELLDSDIEAIYTSIDKAKYDIKDTEEKIEQTTKDIVVAQDNIKGEEALFNERMRVMYMNGTDSYLEIIFDSEGIEDLISRVENVKSIVQYDNKMINELNVKKNNIQERKNALDDNKIRVLALKVDNENKLDKLSVVKEEQSKLIVEAEKQQQLHKNEISETQASLGRTINRIEDASNESANYDIAIASRKESSITPSRGNSSYSNNSQTKVETEKLTKTETKNEPAVTIKKEVTQTPKPSSSSSNEVIAYAKTFLGTPYEWAATGPNTFDCSGFTQYVYAHFGVATGRSTYDQINAGSYVSRDNLQAGDLVLFGSGSPHHVGIYVGNNSYIHAPRTGDVVKISQLTRSDYMTARRVK